MKKIIFYIPTLTGGGAEHVLVNLVNSLDPKKYDITVKSIIDKGYHRKSLKKHVKYRYSFKFKFFSFDLLAKWVPLKILYKLILEDKGDYDIEIAFLHGATTSLLAGGRKAGKKIAWIHNDLKYYPINKLYRGTKHLTQVYKEFDAIVGVSKTVIESFSDITNINEKVYVKYNINESEKIIKMSSESIEEDIVDKNALTIISTGRLVEQKKFERLINIQKLLIEDGVKAQIIILGEGKERKMLESLIMDNGLGDSVKLLGYQNNPYKYLKNADLFVCSSLYEGLSTAVTEAVILGIPIISTETSGIREILGDNSEYGLIVENSFEALYEAVKDVATNKALLHELKQKVEKRKDHFNKAKLVRDIDELFVEVCKN